MTVLAKLFVFIGLAFVATGVLLYFLPQVPGLDRLGKLPGDIQIEGKNFRFYFPWVTCLLVSLILTLLFYFLGGSKR